MKRRHSDQDAQSRSDASSNGIENITDPETDVGHSGASSAQNTRQVRGKMLGDSASPSTPPPPPPAKKKRTRTLTTPHQSAVLHALLAQSRFPTTAMREEVGRSIGLSARKVQVWFQNQRQKARRPRDSKNHQGSPAAPARPPQYGAFPNVPAAPFLLSSASSTVNPHGLPSDDLYATTHPVSAPFVQFSANRAQQQQQPTNTSGRLSGPGVPGTSTISSSTSFAAPPPTHFPHTPQRQQPQQQQMQQTHAPPFSDPNPQTRSPLTLTRDVHPINSTSSARQVMPSRDFTFNHPLPPLHLQVPETGGASVSFFGGSQNQYPTTTTMTPLRPLTAPSHCSLGLSSNASSGRRPRSHRTSSSSSSSPPSPPSPVSEPRPQTPMSSFLVPRHRDLPRLQIPPLHVPESPHPRTNPQQANSNTHAHAHVHVHVHVQRRPQRSAPPLCSPPSPPLSLPPPPPSSSHQDPTRFSHSQPSDRALPSLFRSTSSSASRGGCGEIEISPVPAHASTKAASASSSSSSRARRFDPVREAASECSRSGSLGTDSMSTGTPPRIDTPQRLTTSFS